MGAYQQVQRAQGQSNCTCDVLKDTSQDQKTQVTLCLLAEAI